MGNTPYFVVSSGPRHTGKFLNFALRGRGKGFGKASLPPSSRHHYVCRVPSRWHAGKPIPTVQKNRPVNRSNRPVRCGLKILGTVWRWKPDRFVYRAGPVLRTLDGTQQPVDPTLSHHAISIVVLFVHIFLPCACHLKEAAKAFAMHLIKAGARSPCVSR
jgi:hypothetical protein